MNETITSKLLIDNLSKIENQRNKEIERLQLQEVRFVNVTGMKIETIIELFLQGYKLSKPEKKNLNDYNFKTGKRKLVKKIIDAVNAFNSED